MSGLSGAIEAGQAFVKFYGDMSQLMRDMKTVGPKISSMAAGISKDVSTKLAGGYNVATTAATNFGAKASASMTQAAASTQAVAVSAFRIPGAFGAAFGTFRFVTSNLGNIARGAGLASFAIARIAGYLQVLGYNTKPLRIIQGDLTAIGWGARTVAIGFGIMLTPLRVVANTLKTIAMIGRGLGFLGRLGSIASIGAMSATAASPTASPSEQVAEGAQEAESGGFKKYLMPIITGLAIAGPVGAAATALGVFIAGAFQKSAKSGAGFFATVQARAIAWAHWLGGLFGQITKKVQSVFGQMSSTAEPFITRLEKAFIPLTYAIENVWLPAFLNAIEYVGSFFKSNTESMGQTWTDWILDSVSALAEFIGNFDLYFQIAQQTIVLWASNAIIRVGDFFTNVGEWLKWFGDNWKSVLVDVGNMYVTFLSNMVTNWGNAFQAVIDFAKGKGFKFEMVNPLEGFESSIKELPKLTRSALAETTPELEALFAALGKRQADAEEKGRLIDGVNKASEIKKTGRDPKFGAVSAQSQEGFSLLAQLQNKGQARDPVVENTKQMVKEQKETNKKLKTVVGAFQVGAAFEIP